MGVSVPLGISLTFVLHCLITAFGSCFSFICFFSTIVIILIGIWMVFWNFLLSSDHLLIPLTLCLDFKSLFIFTVLFTQSTWSFPIMLASLYSISSLFFQLIETN